MTTGSWPTQNPGKCNLPAELERVCVEFSDFYLSTHSGRKLAWQTNMGNIGAYTLLGHKVCGVANLAEVVAEMVEF